MLAEAVHPCGRHTSNQALLLLGSAEASDEATDAPVRLRPQLVSSIRSSSRWCCSPRCGSSRSRGLPEDRAPAPADLARAVAIAILVFAIGLELQLPDRDGGIPAAEGIRKLGSSFAIPVTRICRWCRSRDTGALASSSPCSALGLTVLTGNPIWDGVGTALIGARSG